MLHARASARLALGRTAATVSRQREVGVIHGRNGARTELHLQTTAGEPTRVVFPKVMGQQAHETAFSIGRGSLPASLPTRLLFPKVVGQ